MDIDSDVDFNNDAQVSQVANMLRDRRASSSDTTPAKVVTNYDSVPSPQDLIYLVLDTNFIISHLKLLIQLQQLHTKYADSYKIIIPAQVVQELDGLKTARYRKDQPDLAVKARSAIDWCYACFHENDSVVQGQKISQVIDPTATKDDSILDCCLYFKQEHPSSLVILMTNDKNLCMKALTNGILTISYRPNMTADLIASKIIEESRGAASNSRANLIDDSPPEVDMEIDDLDAEEPPITVRPESSSSVAFADVSRSIYSQVEALVLEAVDYAINDIFGEDVGMIGYDSSKMSSLDDACRAIKKYSHSTFSEFFKNRRLNPVNGLTEMTRAVPHDSKELQQFLTLWIAFLRGIYFRRGRKLRNDLDTIVKSWEKSVDSLN